MDGGPAARLKHVPVMRHSWPSDCEELRGVVSSVEDARETYYDWRTGRELTLGSETAFVKKIVRDTREGPLLKPSKQAPHSTPSEAFRGLAIIEVPGNDRVPHIACALEVHKPIQ